MRRVAVCAVWAIAVAAQAQVWEKWVAPGLTYRMEYDSSLPRVVHGLRWSANARTTEAHPQLAGHTVFQDELAKSRGTVSSMIEETGGIAGINADFFPWSGDPLGLMVRRRELHSKPYPNRSFVAWGPGMSAFGTATYTCRMTAGDVQIVIDGINEECGEGMICLNSAAAGFALAKSPGIAVVVKLDAEGGIPIAGATSGVVTEVVAGIAKRAVAPGEFVVVASNGKASELASLRPGQAVTFHSTLNGVDWNSLEHCVSGGPLLVRDGKWANSWDNEGFKPDFALKRHPRTAVGRAANGDLWFVAIDGRQTMSIGATLEETAKVLIRLGCVEGVNLDGGGSTTLNIFGLTMNRPSDGVERPVANGVVFLGPKGNAAQVPPTIVGPEVIGLDSARGFRVQFDAQTPVPNSEVLWSATGAAWIDQGGFLRPLKEGKAIVRAYAYGMKAEKEITIDAAAAAKLAAKGAASPPQPKSGAPAAGRNSSRSKQKPPLSRSKKT